VDYDHQRLSYAQARETPCTGCEATCCTILPLHDFQIVRMQDLDYAAYLLNFERIELAWLSGTAWRVHYRMPCSNLDPQTHLCTVHNTPAQPNVCKRFNAYTCFYKRIFQSPEKASDTYLRVDRRRMALLSQMFVFDGHREIVGVPDLAGAAAQMPPLEPIDDPPVPPAPMIEAYEEAARTGTGLPSLRVRTFRDFDHPCSGCGAMCCSWLSFPHAVPQSVGNLDHIRFVLGFEGIEVGIDENEQWTVLVRTRCRHFRDDARGEGRCGIFGQPQRPLVCSSYDASQCSYKYRFGQVRPERFLRLRATEFDATSRLFQLDEHGFVLRRPGYTEIRQAIEQGWAHEGPLTPASS